MVGSQIRKERGGGVEAPTRTGGGAGVDTLIDGAIISAGFSSGARLGSLLALALAVELFFLNLSVGSELHKLKSNRWIALVATTAIAALLLAGAIGSFFLLRGLQQTSIAIVLSFGAAALIYLIAEDLLVESIQGETMFSVVMLFAGFLVVLAFKLLGQSHVSA